VANFKGTGRPSVPTTEIGSPAPSHNIGGGGAPFGGGIAPWAQYIDEREYAPDLRWGPGGTGAVGIFDRIQSGDAQAAGLLMATTLPTRRLLWEVDPDGGDPKMADHCADSLGLPVRGEDPVHRRSGFNHDRHMAHALRAIGYGHFYFETVYRIGDDGLAHLAKLGSRPPRTILNFFVGDHGELLGILQNIGVREASLTSAATGMGGQPIDANRLLPYVWNSEDDGDWVGRSMLRPLYRNWLLKDRLIRVDATKHERNGMGVPWFEMDANATPDQIEAAARIAEEIRAGSRGGGAGPGRLRIAAPEGQIPDTVASINYHDQQMSKAFLAPFFDLGQSKAGNRALGQTFADFHINMQDAIADWYAGATQAHIDDEVLINWGPDAQPPKLVWTRVESKDLAIADFALAVEKGLIVVTDELRAALAERFKIAGQSPAEVKEAEDAKPAPPAPPPAPDAPPADEPTPEASQGAKQPRRTALADEMVTKLSGAMTWPELAAAVGRDRKDGTARRARDQLIAEGAILKRAADGRLAPVVALNLPDRELRRQPQPFEVEAAVDFAAMEATFLDGREALVAAVQSMQGAQIDELKAAVEAADGNAEALAKLTVAPVDADVIDEHLQGIAEEGVASARAEHDAQKGGAEAVAMAEPAATTIKKKVRERAEAVSLTLAGGLAAAASKRASAVATLPPAAAADNVAAYLGGLSSAELELQLGGATQQAYNTGRREYMTVNKPQTVYASELLDGNTCEACSAIDGTEWPNVSDAESDYPIGGYVDCEGGLRCRGTLVAVY
jgi:hypothetical protein